MQIIFKNVARFLMRRVCIEIYYSEQGMSTFYYLLKLSERQRLKMEFNFYFKNNFPCSYYFLC